MAAPRSAQRPPPSRADRGGAGPGPPEVVDVAVVGGGLAGVAAAVAAAGQGARTLLLERADALGGNATQAWVHTFCGLYLPAGADPHAPPVWAQRGFARRFAEGLARAGGAGAPERAGRVFVLPTFPGRIGPHAAELCAAAPGLEVRTRTALVAARLAARAGDESELVVAGPEGAGAVRAAAVVDASGDGHCAAQGGAEFALERGDALQSPSFIFRMAGVDAAVARGFSRLRLAVAVADAARRGVLPPGCESVLVRPGAAPDEVYVTLNLPDLPHAEHGEYDPLDERYLATLADVARERAERVGRFLARTRPEFAGARVAACAPRVGVRETRRVLGHCVVSEQDVLAGRRRDDEVALSSWPVELWNDHRRAAFRHPAGPCGVPLGALASRSHPTLGMAGRCLSATHEALGALRVLGTAMATGEAVGVAAALAADARVPLASVEPRRVRDRLCGWGESGGAA